MYGLTCPERLMDLLFPGRVRILPLDTPVDMRVVYVISVHKTMGISVVDIVRPMKPMSTNIIGFGI